MPKVAPRQTASIHPHVMTFTTKSRGPNFARLGILTTAQGTVNTPNFVFCGTRATIKCIRADELKSMGAQIALSNTYHLLLKPGAALIKKQGGLHKFINWDAPMMTDSGGYQIFAMGHGSVSDEIKRRGANESSANRASSTKKTVTISEEGAQFKSYVDGKKIMLSPEISIATQLDLGADLIVQLDECTPYNVSEQYTQNSLRRSLRWGQRSIDYFKQHKKDRDIALLGVIQGGIHQHLRDESVKRVLDQDFFGICVGGSLGSDRKQMHDIVAYTMHRVNAARGTQKGLHKSDDKQPYTHLLGIGEIEDIFWGVEQGIDCFDCVSPTRIARHGTALTKRQGKLNILNSKFKHDSNVIEKECPYWCCKNISRSYLNHLFKSNEMLGMMALTTHNCGIMIRLMSEIRSALSSDTAEDSFTKLKNEWLQKNNN